MKQDNLQWELFLAVISVWLTVTVAGPVLMVPGRNCGVVTPIREASSVNDGESFECAIFEDRSKFQKVMEDLEMEKCLSNSQHCSNLQCKCSTV